MAHRKCARYLLIAAFGLVVVVPFLARAAAKPQRRSAQVVEQAEQPVLRPGQIDLDRSRVYIHVGKKGLGHEHAVEGRVKSGHIDIQAQQDVGKIAFDMTSFVADSDEARKVVGLKGATSSSTQQQVTKNMLSADVLDVARHPTALFVIKSRQAKKLKSGDRVYELEGDFTLHGTTHAIKIRARPSNLLDKENRWRLEGDFEILQTDYGITPYSTGLGAIGVADKLRIHGDIWVAGGETGAE